MHQRKKFWAAKHLRTNGIPNANNVSIGTIFEMFSASRVCGPHRQNVAFSEVKIRVKKKMA